MKIVKCIKDFSIEMCDEDGSTIENEEFKIDEGTIWEVSDEMCNKEVAVLKKIVAKRKLKNGCDQCKEPILKGHVYYRKRTIYHDYDTFYDCGIFAVTTTYCSRCKYRNEQREIRFKKFKEKCNHPEKFINEVWTYIPGEAIKEPSHCECRLCGSYF